MLIVNEEEKLYKILPLPLFIKAFDKKAIVDDNTSSFDLTNEEIFYVLDPFKKNL